MLHYLDLSDKLDAVVVILSKALDALDCDGDSGLAAFGFNNCSEGAFSDFLENLVILGDFHPDLRKAEFLNNL
mgnify:CR=1 FL=1